jgi:hypothetical protein
MKEVVNMGLIKIDEAKRISELNKGEINDEIAIVNVLIKEAANKGLRQCYVNIHLIPIVCEILKTEGYIVINIDNEDIVEIDNNDILNIYHLIQW